MMKPVPKVMIVLEVLQPMDIYWNMYVEYQNDHAEEN